MSLRMSALLVAIALFISACTGQTSLPTESVLGIQAESVEAVVVAWDPALERVPPPKRTTNRRQFTPLLKAMAHVTQKANPPDLLGPPVHITLELKGEQSRRFELWGGYLVDKDQSQTYAVSEALFSDLQSALEPLSPPPIEPPKPLTGRLTPADLVRALQEHGAGETRETGERLPVPLFGAQSGEVIEVLGFKVQVYIFATAEAAQKAASQDPLQLPIDWIGKPHFVAKSNLLITVVHPDEQVSRKIVAYLEMIEVR